MLAARYSEFAHGWEDAEFPYTPLRRKTEDSFMAVRRPMSVEPEGVQLRLFTFRKYTCHRAVVTNLDLGPPAVCQLYCDQDFQELLLWELKGSYAMSKIPARTFWANGAYAEAMLRAYDLVLASQTLCLIK
jgi:hypothetical protein